jgi:hypothetical protein
MSKHLKELKGIKRLHSSSEPAACLHRHGNSKVRKGDCCSYRWQGLRNGEDNPTFYDYPAYKALVKAAVPIQTAKTESFPTWYKKTLKAPLAHQWDITITAGVTPSKNFRDKCYQPYWHEAHHIVPDDVLREAIAYAAEGTSGPGEVQKTIRGGLLTEKYNLNDKLNVFLLPMDAKVGLAIRLPKHRITPETRHHNTYSDKVLGELKEVFKDVKKALAAHKEPDYESCKDQIEKLSKRLHGQIRAAGTIDRAGSLDQMQDSRFRPPA